MSIVCENIVARKKRSANNPTVLVHSKVKSVENQKYPTRVHLKPNAM